MGNKLFKTDLLFTGLGPALKNQYIEVDNSGFIIEIGTARSSLSEAVYYPGAICPGFINAHTHTELAHLKPMHPPGAGMGVFIREMARNRHATDESSRQNVIRQMIRQLYEKGMSGAGDICNERVSWQAKEGIEIRWHHFIECYGADEARAEQTLRRALDLREQSETQGFKASLTPHAPYSIHKKLRDELKGHALPGDVFSFHFMESVEEIEFMSNRSGPLSQVFADWGFKEDFIGRDIASPLDQLLSSFPSSNRLMLVHNTFIDTVTIHSVLHHFSDPWFCLCPQSNQLITGKLPPVDQIRAKTDHILVGTDSHASNHRLSVWAEISALSRSFPWLPLHEIVAWATSKGALFFGWNDLGAIERGRRPGLLWLPGQDNPDKVSNKCAEPRRIV